MQRTIAAIVLGCLLTVMFTTSSLAQTQGNSISARAVPGAKSFVADRGVGKKVKVKLVDGTSAEGKISQIGESSFAIETAKTPLTISYDSVAQVKKAGWSSGAKIGLALGVAAVGVAVVAGIALAKTKPDPFPNGF